MPFSGGPFFTVEAYGSTWTSDKNIFGSAIEGLLLIKANARYTRNRDSAFGGLIRGNPFFRYLWAGTVFPS